MSPIHNPSTQEKETEDPRIAKILSVIDAIAGSGYGTRLFEQLSGSDESATSIAFDIAKSTKFGQLYKSARTLDIMKEGRKDADPALVGLPDLAFDLTFREQFEKFFQPQLALRAEGFQTIFDTVLSLHERPLIIETGCLRIPGNWGGDGQSTFMFDALVSERHGQLFSIDVTLESIDTARHACSSATQLICNDSVAALDALADLIARPVSLLYLDSFDLDIRDPLPSAIHHLMELTAARPLIGSGTVVCIDDYAVSGQKGGKGMLVDRFCSQIRMATLYSGYQKAWLCA